MQTSGLQPSCRISQPPAGLYPSSRIFHYSNPRTSPLVLPTPPLCVSSPTVSPCACLPVCAPTQPSQCARFHPLSDFDGSHRSCRSSSARHAERRRQLRRANSCTKRCKRSASSGPLGSEHPDSGGGVPAAKRACITPCLWHTDAVASAHAATVAAAAAAAAAAAGLCSSGGGSSGCSSGTTAAHRASPRQDSIGQPEAALAPLDMQGSGESALDSFCLAAAETGGNLVRWGSLPGSPWSAQLPAVAPQQQAQQWEQEQAVPALSAQARQLLHLLPATAAALNAALSGIPAAAPAGASAPEQDSQQGCLLSQLPPPLSLPIPETPQPVQQHQCAQRACAASQPGPPEPPQRAEPLPLSGQVPGPLQLAALAQREAMLAAFQTALLQKERQRQQQQQELMLQQYLQLAAGGTTAAPAPAMLATVFRGAAAEPGEVLLPPPLPQPLTQQRPAAHLGGPRPVSAFRAVAPSSTSQLATLAASGQQQQQVLAKHGPREGLMQATLLWAQSLLQDAVGSIMA